MSDKKNVIRLFLKSGFQISKKTLPLVLSNPNEIIHELKKIKPRPFIVTERHIKKISKPPTKQKIEIKKIGVYKKREGPISIEDCVKFFRSRYEKIKNILSKHMAHEKLISINKITKQSNTFSIIGIVRNREGNKLLLEDLSGEAYIFFDDRMKAEMERVVLDDVVGVKCKKIREKIYGKKIIFPDIWSSREISRSNHEIKIALVSYPESLETEKYQKLISLLNTEKNLILIFLLMKEKNKKILEDFSKFKSIYIHPNFNPTIFEVERVKIMVLPRHFFVLNSQPPLSFNSIISILRKRFLSIKSDLKKIEETDLVLEDIPDIVISNFGENNQKNYKGTTIISNSDPQKVFLINLKSREARVEAI